MRASADPVSSLRAESLENFSYTCVYVYLYMCDASEQGRAEVWMVRLP